MNAVTVPPDAPQFLRLDGRASTIVFEIAALGAPLWRYWGQRLDDDLGTLYRASAVRPRPTFALDGDFPLSLFPTFGLGWFGQSALLAHREGRDFAQDFSQCSIKWERPGGAFVATLNDPVAQIGIETSVALSPLSDLLTLKTRLWNFGAAALDVTSLAAGVLRIPADATRILYFSGRHNNEFIPYEDDISPALWRRENRRGLTSHDCFPGALVFGRGACNQTGAVYAAHLAWSGDSVQTIERLDDGAAAWHLGEWLAPGECRIAPGAHYETPELLATYSDAGFDGAAQNFHAAIRARGPWRGLAPAPRPVHLNTWEGVYFNHRFDDLKDLAQSAAAIGVERFVLDDGWFEGRNDDTTSLGDWRADRRKYPDGLRPLADYVRSIGMEFGLWVEPEMVSQDSGLYRAHPDWALALDRRRAVTGRNQLALDLSRADVGAYLFEVLDGLLSSMPIAYLKWDHNRDLAPASGADGRAIYGAQTRGFYRLIDRIRHAHPSVEIESCAGGGGRIDAGVLARTHRVWTSDCLDADMRLAMHRGFLQFFPPEVMGAHVGAAPAHATGRSHSMAFRAMTALTGHFGVELDPRRLSAADRAGLIFWINQHKELRPLLHGGLVWRGQDQDGLVWQAHGAARDFVLIVSRTAPAARRIAAPLRLPFAVPGATYRIDEIAHAEQGVLPAAGTELFQAMRSGGASLRGAWLAQEGLPIPPLAPASAALFRVKAS